MSTRNYDEGIIERWRVEPPWGPFELDESSPVEEAPPLWKDLALASVAALVLWIVTAALLR